MIAVVDYGAGNLRSILKALERQGLEARLVDSPRALDGAEALVVVTEWLVYRNPDFARMKQVLRRPLVIDGRNLYEPGRMRALGFEYHGIGRNSP